MAQVIIVDPQDVVSIEIDWADSIGADTLGSVTHSVSSPLVKVSEATNVAGKTSTVKISGVEHGGEYYISAQTSLAGGDTLNRQFKVLGFNS